MRVVRRHIAAHIAALACACALSLAGCRSDEYQEPDLGEEDLAVEDAEVTPPPPGQEASVQPPKNDAGVQPPKKDGAVQPPKKDGAVQPPKKDGPLPPKPDSAVPKPDVAKPKPDTTAWPAVVPGKVAAIQYGQGQAAQVSAVCAAEKYPDICALEEMIIQARAGGASLIVAPEFYVLKQVPVAPDPTVGTNPAATPGWPDDNLLYLSQFAKQLGVYLVYDLITYTGTEGQPGYKEYNTQIAFAPDGKIVARHHKFNLFGGEPSWATAGTDVTVFDTPLGKVGLLICADIYGSTTLLNQLAYTLKARVVAISSYWTTSNPGTSYYGPYAKKYGVYAVVANETDAAGYGGGVYGPTGAALASWTQPSPKIVYYTFPQLPVP